MNASKRKGTAWEAAIVDHLRECGWPHVERRALNGSVDRGDIAGIPGVVIEAKNEKTITLAAYLDEANTERRNDHANIGVAWFKRRGRTSPADGYVLMDGAQFTALLREAGYHPEGTP